MTPSRNIIQQLFSVSGKNVLITGSSRGIGLMIASSFVQAGANVLITSRDEKACQVAIQTIQATLSTTPNQSLDTNGEDGENARKKKSSPSLHYVVSNLSTRQGCLTLANQTREIFQGRLHVLINNAACSWGEDPYYDHPETTRSTSKMNWGWDKVLDLNVKSIFYLTRDCMDMLSPSSGHSQHSNPIHTSNMDDSEEHGRRVMMENNPGRVINIGSVAGIVPQEAPTHAYDVSKAAVHHLTLKMAADLASRNITVNAIAPGFVSTRMSQGLQTWGPDLETISKAIPLQRLGTSEDMAGAAIYLSSQAGSWCTGMILNVDGGTVGTMRIPLSSL